jgi:transcriptional regulator with XRE-family HTH domain
MSITIGDNIRLIRDKEKNYTQSYVAKELGITTKAYGNIENNVSDPSFSKLLKIAEIFECDVNYIVNYQRDKGTFNNNFYHNTGTSIMHQGNSNTEEMKKLYEDMLASKQKVISMYEHLLREKGVNINF